MLAAAKNSGLEIQAKKRVIDTQYKPESTNE
jgi:hypothetical protein